MRQRRSLIYLKAISLVGGHRIPGALAAVPEEECTQPSASSIKI
jgi:hypothetical protein